MSNEHNDAFSDPRLSRRRFLAVGGGTVAALATGGFVAACGGGGSTPSAGGAAAAAGTPRRGGSLRVGISGGSSKDSLSALAATAESDIARASQLYDTLMEFDADYNLQPGLAEEVVPSKNATEWTIRLVDGVTLHDGKPMTAEDLKYTFQLVTDPKDPGAAASRLSTLKRDGMKVMDERTLRLTFDGPFSPLPDVLGETGSSALRVVGRGYDVRNPVGTGPFKFKSFTPGERSVFVRNENYWRDGSPHLDEVVLINFTDDAARVNALLSGQVDAIAGVPNSQVRVLEANEKVSVINSVTGSWNPITMRVDAAPLDDKRVRQALRLLADREELVAQVLGGHGTVGNDLFGKFDPAFNAELPQREVDVEQARSLLKQAGRENLSLDFYTSPVSVGLVAAAEAFVQQASKAGVDLRLRQVDSSTYFDRFFMKVPLAVSYWGTRNYLLQAADSMMPNAPYNETHWSHEGWTKLVTAAFAETDDAKRKQLIGDAQAIEHEEGGYINWGFYNRIDAVSSKVGGVVANRSGFSLNAYRLRDAWLNA